MNINVVYLNMEYGIHEQVTQNHDGSYTIFLNSRDSREMNQFSYLHAMHHINNNDFEKHDVQLIEAEAHNMKGEYIWQRKKEFQE